jgi:hypothetical protein
MSLVKDTANRIQKQLSTVGKIANVKADPQKDNVLFAVEVTPETTGVFKFRDSIRQFILGYFMSSDFIKYIKNEAELRKQTLKLETTKEDMVVEAVIKMTGDLVEKKGFTLGKDGKTYMKDELSVSVQSLKRDEESGKIDQFITLAVQEPDVNKLGDAVTAKIQMEGFKQVGQVASGQIFSDTVVTKGLEWLRFTSGTGVDVYVSKPVQSNNGAFTFYVGVSKPMDKNKESNLPVAKETMERMMMESANRRMMKEHTSPAKRQSVKYQGRDGEVILVNGAKAEVYFPDADKIETLLMAQLEPAQTEATDKQPLNEAAAELLGRKIMITTEKDSTVVQMVFEIRVTGGGAMNIGKIKPLLMVHTLNRMEDLEKTSTELPGKVDNMLQSSTGLRLKEKTLVYLGSEDTHSMFITRSIFKGILNDQQKKKLLDVAQTAFPGFNEKSLVQEALEEKTSGPTLLSQFNMSQSEFLNTMAKDKIGGNEFKVLMLGLLRKWDREGMGAAEEAFADGVASVMKARASQPISELTAKYITFAAMHQKVGGKKTEAAEGATTSNDIAFAPDQFGKKKKKSLKEEGIATAEPDQFNQEDEDKRQALIGDDNKIIRGKDIADMLNSRSRQQN